MQYVKNNNHCDFPTIPGVLTWEFRNSQNKPLCTMLSTARVNVFNSRDSTKRTFTKNLSLIYTYYNQPSVVKNHINNKIKTKQIF